MTSLNHQIRIRSSYTRSINLQRDSDNLDLINSYLLTSKAIQARTQSWIQLMWLSRSLLW